MSGVMTKSTRLASPGERAKHVGYKVMVCKQIVDAEQAEPVERRRTDVRVHICHRRSIDGRFNALPQCGLCPPVTPFR